MSGGGFFQTNFLYAYIIEYQHESIYNLSGLIFSRLIVKEYMQMIGGTIVFKSIPGRGSVFRIEMPVFAAETQGILDRDDYVG